MQHITRLLFSFVLIISSAQNVQADGPVAILVTADTEPHFLDTHARARDFYRRHGYRVIEVLGSRGQINRQGLEEAFRNAQASSEMVMEVNIHGNSAGVGDGSSEILDPQHTIYYSDIRRIITAHQNSTHPPRRMTVVSNSCLGGYFNHALRGIPGVQGYFAANGGLAWARRGSQGFTEYTDLLRRHLDRNPPPTWEQAHHAALRDYSRGRVDEGSTVNRRGWRHGMTLENTTTFDAIIEQWCQNHPSTQSPSRLSNRHPEIRRLVEERRNEISRISVEVSRENSTSCSRTDFRTRFNANLRRMNSLTLEGLEVGLTQARRSLGRLTADSRGEQYIREAILPRLASEQDSIPRLRERLEGKWRRTLTMLENCQQSYRSNLRNSQGEVRDMIHYLHMSRLLRECGRYFSEIQNDPETLAIFNNDPVPSDRFRRECDPLRTPRRSRDYESLIERSNRYDSLRECVERNRASSNAIQTSIYLMVTRPVEYRDICGTVQPWTSHLQARVGCYDRFMRSADTSAWNELENQHALGRNTIQPTTGHTSTSESAH